MVPAIELSSHSTVRLLPGQEPGNFEEVSMFAYLRSSRRLSVAFFLTLSLGVLMAALLTPPAQAQNRCPSEFYYYSDDTYTDLVGYEVYACGNCAHSSWGVKTVYRVWEPLTCAVGL
jgi:hypothetical protein